MPSVPPSKNFRITAGLCLIAVAASIATTIAPLSEFTRSLVGNSICILAGAFGAVGCWRAAYKLPKETRLSRMWALIGSAFASWALGTGVWTFYQAKLEHPPFPSPADAFYLACIPLFFLGMLSAPRVQISGQEKIKLTLDASSALVAGLLVFGSLVVAPIIQWANPGLVSTLLSLIYPTGVFALLWGLARLIHQRKALRDSLAAFLLSTALLADILACSLFSYQQLRGTYESGRLPDVIFTLAMLLGGLAGFRMTDVAPHLLAHDRAATAPLMPPSSFDSSPRFWRYLPPIVIPVAMLVLAWSPVLHFSAQICFLVLGSLVFVTLVFIRQMVALRENQALNHSLRQRTAELQKANEQIQRQYEERQRIEAEQQEFAVKMQQVQRLESLGVLAGGIAHDFNNLLTVIIGNTSLAADMLPPGHRAGPFLEDLEKAALRAAGLTNQMLAYSGKGAFALTQIDLNALTRENATLLDASISKKARFQLELADQLPKIEGDPNQLTQVVMNLITNASEAIDPRAGTIRIRTGSMMVDQAFFAQAALPDALPSGHYVFLEVSDDGAGMDAETVARIFEPFFTTKFTGRGLGLAATLGIIRGHKGSIQVHSEPGEGTRFLLVFPPAEGVGPGPEPARVPQPPIQGKPTVLIVDDESLVRNVATRLLRQEGFRTLEATHGGEAIEAVAQHGTQIDAILLDLMMPVMGGEEAFHEIRRLAPMVPILLASGFTETAVTARFGAEAPTGFLQKPFTAERLTHALREAMEKGRKAAPAEQAG